MTMSMAIKIIPIMITIGSDKMDSSFFGGSFDEQSFNFKHKKRQLVKAGV